MDTQSAIWNFTLFYVTHILFKTHWMISIERFSGNRMLGVALFGFSARILGQGFARNYRQALACRLLLGFFESGVMPCMIFIISTIWNRHQQAKCVAGSYCATAVSDTFGGLIAYGIQTVGGLHSLEAWHWLFIIEAIISFIIGGIIWVSMRVSAEKTWFLTPQQTEIMALKKQRDISFKGKDSFEWKYVTSALLDPLVYLAPFSLFSSSLPLLGFGVFLPTIIAGFGQLPHDSGLRSSNDISRHNMFSLRSTPQTSTFSHHRPHPRSNRLFHMHWARPTVAQVTSPCSCALQEYTLTTPSWVSSNSAPDLKRSVAIPLAATIANVSGVLSGQICPPIDAPRYMPGNAISLGLEFVALLGVAAIYGLLKWREARNKRQLLRNAGDDHGRDGDRSPDFMFFF
ncbi:hypothetical protein AJ78_00185 [Emergomyces pasteurianus Ep9510]|uniref:Major facilitator superfamily (MFS) profile domain-containing protein n=1 Tax=Emergomyces pasteurianus Ep9510 TaxID=1447872 RepID=A0A1J9PVB0_9EURO|nr:hypothetical protein AJ78_00185 [Emergomyces pasteurianus Ep9510]